jgi:hypothetical protein
MLLKIYGENVLAIKYCLATSLPILACFTSRIWRECQTLERTERIWMKLANKKHTTGHTSFVNFVAFATRILKTLYFH